MSERAHLLLAIGADGNALALVETAWRLSHATGATWSVVAIDTPATEGLRIEQRGPFLQALDRAQQLGATTTRISTGSNTASALVSSLVHRAISENATTLVLGHQPDGSSAWLQAGQGLSAFVEALSRLLPGVSIHLICEPLRTLARQHASRRKRWPRLAPGDWRAVALALGASTAVGGVLERHLDPANIVMIYLAGVVYVASRAGKAPAITTVLGSIFLYDLIFVHPRWSLKPTEPQYWLAFLVMMVVGLLISQLAARTREQAMLAESRAQRSQALNQLSLALGRARDREAVSQALCAAVRSSVDVQATLVFTSGAADAADAGPARPAGFDPHWAEQALAGGLEVGAGTAAGGEQPLRYVPVLTGETAFGLLVMSPPEPERDSLEDRHLVRALANQAAIALERAELERKSVAAAVETEVERTRNTLLAGISHDFRTPLTTIVGSATMLIEQAPAIDAGHREQLLRTLLDEAHRLHVLTSNLLDLTRLDEGAIQLRAEWCPADELLETAQRQLEPRLRGHTLCVSVPPDALVWCDPRLIDQLLVNLLDNAARHVPAGGAIRVAITVAAQRWTLTVHDDGPGIPPGHEKAVFRKFYRGADDADSSGKGLGLAICAAIASLHGGEIRVENDAGARFTLSLPQPSLPELDPGEPA